LRPLSLYQKFEHVCLTILTGLIAMVIVFAIWKLTVKIASCRPRRQDLSARPDASSQ
jgi:hypothetical protein